MPNLTPTDYLVGSLSAYDLLNLLHLSEDRDKQCRLHGEDCRIRADYDGLAFWHAECAYHADLRRRIADTIQAGMKGKSLSIFLHNDLP